MTTVGDRIYYCRLEHKMTQKELGAKTGIDSATIGKYERGVLHPKVDTLRKLAAALDVPWTVLFAEDEAPAAPDVPAETPLPRPDGQAAEGSAFPDDRARALHYLEQLTACGQDVAARTALALLDQQLGHDSARKFRCVLPLFGDDALKALADSVESLAQVPAYRAEKNQ